MKRMTETDEETVKHASGLFLATKSITLNFSLCTRLGFIT